MWGYHDNVEDILSTIEGVQYRGGYHEYRGGYLQYCGDIMMHVEQIMSTVGCSVPWGYSNDKRFFPP